MLSSQQKYFKVGKHGRPIMCSRCLIQEGFAETKIMLFLWPFGGFYTLAKCIQVQLRMGEENAFLL